MIISFHLNRWRSYGKIKKFTFSLVLIGLLLWFIGFSFGSGQQEVEKWAVETHDRTNFPLTGRHRTVSCGECHLDKVFEGTPTACEVCHWERRQDDRYNLRLGTHCADCHTTLNWKNVPPNNWNHTAEVGYILEGVHRTLDCVECHGESGFVRVSIECFSCHEEDYEDTEEPDHASAGFPPQCQLCHLNTSQWEGAVFTHDAFRLRGQHRTASCQDCHSSGVYRGLPSDCVDCHLDDYNETDDPDHRELGFPLDCTLCHRSNADTWENTRFSHSAFPLKGKHRTASCSECHTEGIYEGLPSDCVDCHLEDYNEADDPDHRRLNFPTDCEQCHGTNAVTWDNANFDHTSIYPLQGAHKNLDCTSCHATGYALPRECYGCHSQDYEAARNPNHRTAGFPTACESCHFPTHNYWSQAVFDHRFPIESGRHNGLSCTDCHLSSNYRDFSCIDCHAHEKTEMDNEHRGISGYAYNSQSCYGCHPQGRE